MVQEEVRGNESQVAQHIRGKEATMSQNYGHRARVGYACPPKVAEVFVYEFYKIAPPGVTLAISTVGGGRANLEDLKEAAYQQVAAAEELAKNGLNVVVLGGEPLNAALGDELPGILKDLTQRYGIPFTTSMTAQAKALELLDAHRIGVVNYSDQDGVDELRDDSSKDIKIIAQKKAGYPGVHHLGRIPTDVVPRLAKELKEEHPEIDTIKIVCAHWASVEAIDNIEQELGVGAVSNSLGITWYALRQAGITDSIPGKGRLLREF
jgi:maleate isomerase